jgi:hypothetical protein
VNTVTNFKFAQKREICLESERPTASEEGRSSIGLVRHISSPALCLKDYLCKGLRALVQNRAISLTLGKSNSEYFAVLWTFIHSSTSPGYAAV